MWVLVIVGFRPQTTTTSALSISSGGSVRLTPRPSNIPASPAPSHRLPLVNVPSICSKSRLVTSCITPKFPDPRHNKEDSARALATASNASCIVTSTPSTEGFSIRGHLNISLLSRLQRAPVLVLPASLGKCAGSAVIAQASGQSSPQAVLII